MSEIARMLEVARSTVYREVKRGQVTVYDSKKARYVSVYDYMVGERIHRNEVSKRGRKLKIGHDMRTARALEHYLSLGYSPYATIQTLRAASELGTELCTQTLYNYIRWGVLGVDGSCLRLGFRPKHHKRADDAFEDRTDMDPTRRNGGSSIAERPRSILSRKGFGHWEGDLVVSGEEGHACLLTLVERKTRYIVSTWLPDKKQQSIASGLDSIERRFGDGFEKVFKTLTLDNGMEFRDTRSLMRSCYAHKRNGDGEGGRFVAVYYAHPYCSCERGSNENANRMMRWRFKKGTNLDMVEDAQVQEHTRFLNSYPRGIFGGKSAKALFKKELASLGIPS